MQPAHVELRFRWVQGRLALKSFELHIIDGEKNSMDFDTKYLEEENILMKASGYGEDGVMQLPVRSPGVPLPPHIMDENAKFVAKEQRQLKRDEAAKQAQLAAEAAAAAMRAVASINSSA